MHNVEVPTSDSDYDNRNGEIVALDDEVDNFLTIMDLSIGEDEEDHVVCS